MDVAERRLDLSQDFSVVAGLTVFNRRSRIKNRPSCSSWTQWKTLSAAWFFCA
jgi:hypothetical protein